MTRDAVELPELPEYRDNPFINRLPPVLSIADALRTLTNLPTHSDEERHYPAHLRCHCLQRLGRYFVPLERHLQLEARLSALIRQGYVGRNPNTTDYLHRLHNDHERVLQKNLFASVHPVESTASGFALIGCSGIGKTKSVERVLHLYPKIIHHQEPFSLQQVVWLKLECPHKGSAKQLCISFFHEVDKLLGTRFQARYGSSRLSIDEMVVRMAEVADRHALGILVIDEIQHLMRAPGAGRDDLLNFLVALVNTIGIPVMIVGTPAALPLLQGAFRQARRASGLGSLIWERHANDATWNHFIERMWRYQWTREPTPLTDDLRRVLYEESQGIVDLVVKLYMLAQLQAIQLNAVTGRDKGERMTAGLFKHVASDAFRLLAPMITALKRNDRAALEHYDDLQPLDDYVFQAFQAATIRLSAMPASATAMPPEKPPTPPVEDGSDAILASLQGVGLARDIAEVLLIQAKAENPGLSPLDLVATVIGKLRERGPEAKPVKSRRNRETKSVVSALPADPADIRTIVSAATTDDTTAYDALLAAGVIKPPLLDVAV
ncbi:ATP-binding protein [Azospirillum doebereinerae]